LVEAGALFERNNGPGLKETVLDTAATAGIAVLANRPLNAFANGILVRLADISVEETVLDWEEQLGRVADLEMSFRAEIAPKLQAAPDSLDPGDYFRMAERLKEARRVISGAAHWSQIEAQITFALTTVVAALNQQLEGELAQRWIDWRDGYLGELEDLMRDLSRQAAEKSNTRNSMLRAALDPHLPQERRSESLARKALWTVASTPGVTCALNGMRTVAYVEDSSGMLPWPRLEPVDPVYRAARAALLSQGRRS
jgi:hypothetical protein